MNTDQLRQSYHVPGMPPRVEDTKDASDFKHLLTGSIGTVDYGFTWHGYNSADKETFKQWGKITISLST